MWHSDKMFYSDPGKDRLVCTQTYKLLNTLEKLGLKFKAPIREILAPYSSNGLVLDRFYRAFVKVDDDE